MDDQSRPYARCDKYYLDLNRGPGTVARRTTANGQRQVGAHFGPTPTKYQSGETNIDGRIAKAGDPWVRTAHHEAAHTILAGG